MTKNCTNSKESSNKKNYSRSKNGNRRNRNGYNKKEESSNTKVSNNKLDDGYEGRNGNDLNWHVKSQTLLTGAASVPWSYATGRPLQRNQVSGGSGTFVVPGIMAIYTAITPGVSGKGSVSLTSAINTAARAIYTDIRSKLKSANAYDASDVIIYMTALSEVKALIAFITRAFGTTLNYSFMNAYLPDDLLSAQNIDAADLHENFTDYRSRANQLIAKASQIWWPKGFDYVTKAEWEYSNYFSEGKSIKDQIYMFVPSLFRKYELTEEGGRLVPFFKNEYGVNQSLSVYLDALSTMIEAIIGDSDFQNISGDLYNCYGAGGVETFSLIPENIVIQPVFSLEVLEQMQNARCLNAVNYAYSNLDVSSVSSDSIFVVAQNPETNQLVVNNVVEVSNPDTSLVQLLRLDAFAPIFTVHDEPSPDKTMLITRLSNVVTQLSGISTTAPKVTIDTAMDLVTGFRVFWRNESTGILTSTGFTSALSVSGTFAAIISAFHYHPILDVVSGTSGTPYPIMLGAIDIYTSISSAQLVDMNRVDLLSLFAVPDIGKVNG